MNEAVTLVLTGLAGVVLGVVFFGGLWWTVRKGLASKRPALWFVGSVLVRTGIVLGGFYLVSGGRLERLLACLLGLVIARFGVTFLMRPRPCHQAPARQTGLSRQAGPTSDPPIGPEREAHHAS